MTVNKENLTEADIESELKYQIKVNGALESLLREATIKLYKIDKIVKEAEKKIWYYDSVGFLKYNFMEDLRRILNS